MSSNASPKKPARRRTAKNPRLSREDWLEATLKFIGQGKVDKLRIEVLAETLDVTKGSFYWHFKNWGEFVGALLDYWAAEFTSGVSEVVGKMDGTAEERLFAVAEIVTRQDRAQFDAAMHWWALKDAKVAKVVARVEAIRLEVVRSLFAEIGFEGEELEMRTRTFVVFHSFELSLRKRLSKAERQRHLELRHTMLVGKV
ncbi:MAG: TetR/AcrR family transcriptional regulator [Verrucomicrobiales bacterium]